MKKIFTLLTVLTLVLSGFIAPVHAQDIDSDKVYISETSLSEDEMIEIFSKGYTKIISYNNSKYARTSGTHTETTCTAMKKRDYGYLGYSKQCFHETYTSVTMSSGTFSMSIGIKGVSVSFPIANMKNAGTTGSYSLSASDNDKVHNSSYYSCLRVRGYMTWAQYTSKTYDNASGQLINTSSYTHTYTYKNNKSSGLDYYLVARSSSACNTIKANNYLGTSAEINAMSAWKTVANPGKESVTP